MFVGVAALDHSIAAPPRSFQRELVGAVAHRAESLVSPRRRIFASARVDPAGRRSSRGSEAREITIAIADHHHLIREGVRLLLGTEKDFEVVAEIADGLKVADLVDRHKPRVLILASGIPGLDSLEVIRRVRERSPGTAVIALSTRADEQQVVDALRSGASGFVATEARGSDLMRAIRKVAAGGRYLSAPFRVRSMDMWLQRAKIRRPDPYEALTGREREVFTLVTEGHSNTSIASLLSISRRTAETHRAKAMAKLHLRNQADLIRFAIARGISRLPSKP